MDNRFQTNTTPEQVISMVALTHGVTTHTLKSRIRTLDVVKARQEAYYLLRQNFDISLAEVGRLLGGRTPATVTNGYQKVARKLATVTGNI